MTTRSRALRRIILEVDDTPNRVAAAFGLGVFIAFFPLLGIHIITALGLAVVLRLNKAVLIAGTLTNNPWTVAPMYTAGTLVGCAVLGVSPHSLAEIDWSLTGRAFYRSLASGLGPLLLPFVIGNLLLGAVAGSIAFVVVRTILRRQEARPDPEGEQ